MDHASATAAELADGDEIKVKYGRNNPEVHTEVMATRLLNALGFPADRYEDFEYAVIERPLAGRRIETTKERGWSWQELSMRTLPYGGSTFPDIEISEGGRAFLANRLRELSTEQIRALFASARVSAYPHATNAGRQIDNWVKAFEAKVSAIVSRPACPTITTPRRAPTRVQMR